MLIRQQVVRVKSAAPLDSRIAEDLRAVRQLADYCKTAPNKITESQLRRYFLFLENEKKFAYGSLRVAYSGIKFFFTRTCKRDWQILAQMKPRNIIIQRNVMA